MAVSLNDESKYAVYTSSHMFISGVDPGEIDDRGHRSPSQNLESRDKKLMSPNFLLVICVFCIWY